MAHPRPGAKVANTPLTSRFAAVRLRPASRDYNRTKPHPVEWLIVEWPNGEAEPTKYWLSTLPKDTAFARSRQQRQIALAHRTRLRGAERRTWIEPITKVEVGVAFTTTRHSASQLTASLSANGTRFPPQHPGSARRLRYPKVSDPAAPPIRPERRVENSIATIRKQLTVALAKTLARCPCCQSTPRRPATRLRL